MLRTTCSVLTASAALFAAAQLAPGHPAPLGAHLAEVNAEWPGMAPEQMTDARPVVFTSDAERIATHLQFVRKHLAGSAPIGLSASALAERSALLDSLKAYADRAVFPTNRTTARRTPIFIDESGNACAVGYLMIASGRTDLTNAIRDKMNTAYVRSITPYADVEQWAATHGFTEDELAWIQPTYEFKHAAPPVLAEVVLENGDVLTIQGSHPRAAKRTLTVVRSSAEEGAIVLGTIPALNNVCVLEHAGRIFIGGTPAAGSDDLYEWTGQAWRTHRVFKHHPGVTGLRIVEGTVHAVQRAQDEAPPAEMQLTESDRWQPVTSAIRFERPVVP